MRMVGMVNESEESVALMNAARQGTPEAIGALLEHHRARLLRMVSLRLDRRLRNRIDPLDIVQEAFIDAVRRFPEYTSNHQSVPFFLWLRTLALQRLVDEHRRHLGTRARDAGREVRFYDAASSITAAELAAQFLGRLTSPSAAAIRAEQKARLNAALERMDPIDREILALRHFEMLSNSEAAAVLELKASAASRRYTRALLRLKTILDHGDSPSESA